MRRKLVLLVLLFCLAFMPRTSKAQLLLGLTFTPDGSVVVGQALQFDAGIVNLVGLNVGDLAGITITPSNLLNISSINIENLPNISGLLTNPGAILNISDAFSVVPAGLGAVGGTICINASLLGAPVTLGCNVFGSATPPPPTLLITLAGGAFLFFRAGLSSIKRMKQTVAVG